MTKKIPKRRKTLRRPETPECDKLAAFRADMLTIVAFLEWLGREDVEKFDPRGKQYGTKPRIELCVEVEPSLVEREGKDAVERFGDGLAALAFQRMQAINCDPDKLVRAYFEIDEDKLERERRALLEYTRQ